MCLRLAATRDQFESSQMLSDPATTWSSEYPPVRYGNALGLRGQPSFLACSTFNKSPIGFLACVGQSDADDVLVRILGVLDPRKGCGKELEAL